ncbi:error-prone DNA polymerase [uncultured Corynebacterium sp.]|uniref:error-prone DNA polymerase n=1 Tax=uncultured Corynebacterium sp. TaxID=159447 RepID=UPI0025F241D1|nr:error-prone DNA polymerase [uncultured Corynebacterium sp.]
MRKPQSRSFSQGRPLSWKQLESVLSGKGSGLRNLRAVGVGEGQQRTMPLDLAEAEAEGAEGASQRKTTTPFAELHACSAYNFLRGASQPEQMVATARDLGLSALACVDRDGFYGAARFATAVAESAGADLATVFGAELSLDVPLTVLCKGREGYARLSRLIADARMADPDKDSVRYPDLPRLAEEADGHWLVLLDWRRAGAGRASDTSPAERLVELFGTANVVVELQHTMNPADADRNERLHALAVRHGLREIVSSAPTCATPKQSRLAGAKAALRERHDVATAEPTTHPVGGSWLRSGEEMLQLAGDCDWLARAVATTVDVARECAFTLDLVAPNLPHFPVPEGYTEMSWLRAITERGGTERYGQRDSSAAARTAWVTIDRELETIEQLGFPGYFLIVHDIVAFCHENNIFCQGRGSAANSAVCFALGITTVDAVASGLLFERFLSPERDGPPDIDLDIESGRREEAIQYVYSRYGRENAAQVANVITYRRRGATRDAGRALGYAPGQIDAWTRHPEQTPAVVQDLAEQMLDHPRHLGIHSGGMVICDRPIAQVVPTEWARMEGRSVVQWDKDDCAAVGLVKFDLLGLGMLEALHHAVDQVRAHRGREVELWRLDPTEPEVYAMLARADAVGVFQVESRAQMSTLPRLKPRTFYDLVVEVALIRPGPIQGGSVHPYIRRRNGLEPVTFDHPCLEPALTKTLGIPLFQEQLMQMAVDAAGFSGAEADTLRRAMGSKRSPQKMERLKKRFYQGLEAKNGICGAVADRLWDKIVAFASYGFPESHSQSFASLVYYSAWFKYHYPAEFCVALLRAQPMGFYSPQSLLADARRHGVEVLPVDVNASDVQVDAVVSLMTPPRTNRPTGVHGGAAAPAGGADTCARVHNEPRGVHGLGRGTGEAVGKIRLGLSGAGGVKGIPAEVAERIVEARERIGRFTSVEDLSREAGLTVAYVEKLARAGALGSLGLTRRQAVWAAGVAATERPGMLPGTSGVHAPALPGMSAFEMVASELATTGVTTNEHPVRLLREYLNEWHLRPAPRGVHSGDTAPRGGAAVVTADSLLRVSDGTRVRVAGVVTHRQRPATAGGVVFFGLEDETGLANVVVSQGLWARQRVVALNAKILVVRGIAHNAEGAATVTADLLEQVETQLRPAGEIAEAHAGSRDFR